MTKYIKEFEVVCTTCRSKETTVLIWVDGEVDITCKSCGKQECSSDY